MPRIVWTLLFSFFALATTLNGQETRLAQQYFQDGEYEKAAQLYQRLYQQSGNNGFFFERYVESLIALERFDLAEGAIQKQLKIDPENVRLHVSYGHLLEQQSEPEAAIRQYERAIAKLTADQYQISRLANAFITLSKYEYAIQAYERGAKLLNSKRVFSYNLGELYRRSGDIPKMIHHYLNALGDNPGRINQIKTLFQRYLSPDEMRELQTQLYARIQDETDSEVYPNLLAWVFIQKKDYRGALRQVSALDRRFQENGMRVFQLATIALNDRDYDAAIQAFDYIVEQKGANSSFYIDAKREGLRARRLKLVDGYDYTEDELRQLEQQYESFLTEFGRSHLTAGILIQLAELEAVYLNDLERAVAILDSTIQLPNINPVIQASAKIQLADYYLMQDNVWDATLLYSQVDKAFKEDRLGHEARFRNARLSYYAGNFEWAQAQFEVLKASTSKLIANDALDLSVFILDNLGTDSVTTALQLYADAELLVFQNQFDAAFTKLDTLATEFPEHDLKDDILFLKAQVYEKLRNFEAAAEAYQQIVENHSDGIRADNSLFALGNLYEHFLNDQEKAKLYYETLFIDYSGSTFAVEARKRFRRLRGDNI